MKYGAKRGVKYGAKHGAKHGVKYGAKYTTIYAILILSHAGVDILIVTVISELYQRARPCLLYRC